MVTPIFDQQTASPSHLAGRVIYSESESVNKDS